MNSFTNKARKFLIASCCALLLTGGDMRAAAEPLSGAEKALVSFYGYARTVEAVMVDIERFAAYRKGNHGLWEERIGQDLRVLRLAKAEAQGAAWPSDMGPLLTSFISAAEALEAYAKAFLNDGEKEAVRAEDLYYRRYERFRDKLEQADVSAVAPAGLADGFDPLDEEYRAFPDSGDREQFTKSAYLLEEKRFDLAAAGLHALREKYRGKPAEGCVALRMVRCALRDRGATVPPEQEKAQIKVLQDLIDSRVYFPNLYDIFVEWRALYQGFYYGVLPEVEIPNLLYMEKQREVITTIIRHLEAMPGDAWARSQLWMLVQLPVIGRSGMSSPSAAVPMPGAE